MNKVQHIATINEYNTIVQHSTLHPLVSIIDFSKLNRQKREKSQVLSLSFGFYAVFMKNNKHCSIRYGRNNYDYQEGTLIFISPGQVVSIEDDGEDYQPEGFALLFHPDLIRGTSLGQNINDYTFFSYNVYEALHLCEQEKAVMMDCLKKIAYEI